MDSSPRRTNFRSPRKISSDCGFFFFSPPALSSLSNIHFIPGFLLPFLFVTTITFRVLVYVRNSIICKIRLVFSLKIGLKVDMSQSLETSPFKSLEDIEKWQPNKNDINVATVSLDKRVKRDPNVPKTLLCHDMMGGYLQDKFPQGSDDNKAYRFYHWQYIDMFIYFSHNFVTIPPPTWTNAAHRNGVQMLGTIITEWKEGLERCKTFLESESAYKALADKLVSIAKYYKFDGWLINIENPIQGEKVANLHGFVKYLTEQMHGQLPGSTVLWYDSVINTGELKWQDALNDKNKMFFEVCDGIFLNYNWNDKKLFDSLSLAKGDDRSMDVYVGIDVFGRGCLGGGGFNTIEALQAIRRFNMSAAIFAQGWVYENQGCENFTQNENKFWGYLDQLLPRYAVGNLPLCSSFCQGYGSQYAVQGQVVSEKSWHNLSLQELQPSYTMSQFKSHMQQYQPGMELCMEDSYNGGACLELSGKLCTAGNPLIFKLFDLEVQPIAEPLLLSYTFKLDKAAAENLEVFMMLEGSVKGQPKKICLYEKVITSETSDGHNSLPVSDDDIKRKIKDKVPRSNYGWKTRCYELSDITDFLISTVSVGIQAIGALDRQCIKLGAIQVLPISFLEKQPILSNLEIQQIDDKTKKLSWTCDHPELVKYYNIYTGSASTEKCIGHCAAQLFYVQLENENSGFSCNAFSIQPVLATGLLGNLLS